MKKQFVEILQEGDSVNEYFLATRKDLRVQHNGGKFLGMVFKDRTGEIGGILWNNAASIAQMFDVGDVVKVRGTVSSYQDRLQLRVDEVLPLRNGEYDPADLVYAPEDVQQTLDRFVAALKTIQDAHLARLVQSFLDDEDFMKRFVSAAAGKKWHHAFSGGLLVHCYEMTRIAEVMCELFTNLDRDLLLATVFLHDIGKLDEMSHELYVEYTTRGKLLGHLTIGASQVQRRIDGIDGFPENLRLQLLHCMVSHHGELANGSPVLPKTLEAIVLYHIDNLDAQADAFARVVAETKGRGRNWSDYISQIDRQIWTKEE